jgi:hypothetical protein
MNSDQIKELTTCIGCECVSCDELPKDVVDLPYYCIFNTSTIVSNDGGKHWCSISLTNESGVRRLSYFDSLGIYPVLLPIIRFINRNAQVLEINKTPVQKNTTSTCGHFSVCFLHYRASGKSFNEFLRDFDDLEENEIKIRRIFKSLEGTHNKKGGQSCTALRTLITSDGQTVSQKGNSAV